MSRLIGSYGLLERRRDKDLDTIRNCSFKPIQNHKLIPYTIYKGSKPGKFDLCDKCKMAIL